MRAFSLVLAAIAAPPPVVAQPNVGTVPAEFATPIGNEKLKNPSSLIVEDMLVEITLGPELIWRGTMTVNRMMGASYSFRMSNAAPKGCPDPIRGSSTGRDLSVELGNSYYGMEGKPNEYRVSVNFSRTRPSASCKPANRVLRVEETVHLLPGEEATLIGDGDFKVRVVRPPA